MDTIERDAIYDGKTQQQGREFDPEKQVGNGNGVASNTTGKPYRGPKTSHQITKLTSKAEGSNAIDALPPLKGLSFLDRYLVVWIILAMGIGIALGNTIDSVGPALQKGEFVGVSVPIGKAPVLVGSENC